MQKMKTLVVLSVALLLSACASTQRLSESDRSGLKAVTVSTDVKKGKLFLLAPGGANIGLMFGAVGGLAASGTLDANQVAFSTFVDAHAVSVGAIVREEFEKVLRESGKVAVVAAGTRGAPMMTVAVPQYGFGVPHLLSANVVAVMQIQCALTDSTGKVLWSESERIFPSIASPMETTTWKQLHDDPKMIDAQWRKAARYLATKVVGTL